MTIPIEGQRTQKPEESSLRKLFEDSICFGTKFFSTLQVGRVVFDQSPGWEEKGFQLNPDTQTMHHAYQMHGASEETKNRRLVVFTYHASFDATEWVGVTVVGREVTYEGPVPDPRKLTDDEKARVAQFREAILAARDNPRTIHIDRDEE